MTSGHPPRDPGTPGATPAADTRGRAASAAESTPHPSEGSFDFDLFICYSTRPDYAQVRQLESFLESFHKLPVSPPASLRPLKVCVDGSDFRFLRTGIRPTLYNHLARSRRLLVMCCPESVASTAVDAEIRFFLETRGADDVLVAVTAGIDPSATPNEVFHRLLLEAGVHERPWYDFRGCRPREAKRHGWVKVRDFDDARVQLAAHLNDTTAGEVQPVWIREQRRQERRRTTIAFGVTIAMAAATGVAVVESIVATRRANEISRRLEAALVQNSETSFEHKDRTGALPWLLAALKTARGYAERENTERLRLGLTEKRAPYLERSWAVHAPVRRAIFSKTGDLVAAIAGPMAYVWDFRSGAIVAGPLRHSDDVNDIAFAADGRSFFTSSDDGTASVWDARSGARRLPAFQHPSGEHVEHVVEAGPHNDLLVTTSYDDAWGSFAHVWSLADGRLVGPPLRHDAVASVSFAVEEHQGISGRLMDTVSVAADGTTFATVLGDRTARVWTIDGEAVNLRAVFVHSAEVVAATLASDGRLLATSDFGGSVAFWKVDDSLRRSKSPVVTDKPYATYTATSFVESILITPDDRSVVAGSADGATVLDAATGRPTTIWSEVDGAPLVALTVDGRRVAGATSTGDVRIWQLPGGEIVQGDISHADAASSLVFSADGNRLLSGSLDGVVRSWQLPSRADASWHVGKALSEAILSSTGDLLAAGDLDGDAYLFDVKTGLILGQPMKNAKGVRGLAFSRDGHRLITMTGNLAVVWDTGSTSTISTLPHDELVTKVRLSGDGARALTGCRDGVARLWDVAAREVVEQFAHGKEINDVQFSPDETRVVTAGDDGTARVWDVASRAQIGKSFEHGGSVTSATFSSDGGRVLTASGDFTARVWAVGGDAISPPMQHSDSILDAEFSPDGRRIATASLDHTGRVWDAATGSPITPPMSLSNRVWSVRFHPSGRWLVLSGAGKTARVFDAATGLAVGPLLEHDDAVSTAEWSAAGDWLLTASRDGELREWSFAEDSRTVTEIERDLARRTLRRVDSTGGLVNSTPDDPEWPWRFVEAGAVAESAPSP